jgi:hypothetical protein
MQLTLQYFKPFCSLIRSSSRIAYYLRFNPIRVFKINITHIYIFIYSIDSFWYKYLDTLFEQKNKKAKNEEGSIPVDSTVLKKVALDELFFDPFCLIYFFTVMGLLEGLTFGQIKDRIKVLLPIVSLTHSFKLFKISSFKFSC